MEQSKLPYAMGFLHCYLLGRYLSLSTQTHTRAPMEDNRPPRGGGSVLGRRAGLSQQPGDWSGVVLSFYAPT